MIQDKKSLRAIIKTVTAKIIRINFSPPLTAAWAPHHPPIELPAASINPYFQTTFPVTVRLNEVVEEIRPGMAAEVNFRFETVDSRERILVPSVCVGEDLQGRFVFIVKPDEGEFGIVQRQPVIIGELTSEGLEVLQGVSEGDLIVTAGINRLSDGQKVRLL